MAGDATQTVIQVDATKVSWPDIFAPVTDAVNSAVTTVVSAIRVYLADTLGTLLVAVYTPVYVVLDYLLMSLQVAANMVYTVFGWLPVHIYASIMVICLIYVVAWLILTVARLIPAIGLR